MSPRAAHGAGQLTVLVVLGGHAEPLRTPAEEEEDRYDEEEEDEDDHHDGENVMIFFSEYFLFLQEQIKDIIVIINSLSQKSSPLSFNLSSLFLENNNM